MKPVLVTAGGRGQNHGGLGAVRSLGSARHEVHVTVSAPFSTAAWSRYCDVRIPVPSVDGPGYAPAIRELVSHNEYLAVLPAGDAALIALQWPGHQLVDKSVLSRRSAEVGLPSAAERVFTDGGTLCAAAHTLTYPVAVKPVAKGRSTSLDVWRADRPPDLASVCGYSSPAIVQGWLDGEVAAIAGVMWGGGLRAVVHQRYVRTWPRECGVASAVVTTGSNCERENIAHDLLGDHDDIFQMQFIGEHLIDVNPRIYGSLTLATRSGVNLPDVVCRLAAGEDVGAHSPLRARPGVRYRWIEVDLRNLSAGLRANGVSAPKLVRALRPHAETAHPDISVHDLGPTVARMLYAARSRLLPS